MRLSHRLARSAVAVPVACLSFVTSSCSLVFASGPPAGHERMTYFVCTESYAMPVWDIISALIGAPAVLPAFALAGSAVYGFSKVSKCNAAKAEVEAAIEKTYSTPEGMRPDVTLDAVHVTLDRSDTLHVGDTARLHAAALNRSGAEIRDRLFQWSSSDLVVAGVDGAGVLTAKSAGVADITAITGGVAGTRRLVVVP